MNTQESEPMISKFALEMVDATHQHTIKVLWRIILMMGIILFAALIVIGYGIWWINQYDTVSYDQNGEGVNIIGDDNRGYYNEPEIEDSTETEP